MKTRKDIPASQYSDSKNLSARANLHARFSTNPKAWTDWVFEQFDLQEGSSILEVGAGPGRLWWHRWDSLPSGCRVVLSDASPGMVAEARQSLRDSAFVFKVIKLPEVPYPDDSFDCVIANHMLYHVPDLPSALAELARVLKPSGTLYAATNGATHMRELHDIICRFVGDFHPETASFVLENGRASLVRCFDDVSVRARADGLVVSDASALSSYVRSMGSLARATERQFSQIEEAIAEETRRHGKITITKDGGIFIARRPKKAEAEASGGA